MAAKKFLHIDLETQSSVDLSRNSVYKYAESDDFGIQLLSYAYGSGRKHTVDLAHGEKIPGDVYCDILSGDVIKIAHNASFERVCLSKALLKPGEYLAPESWRCTMMLARYFNLPNGLEDLCKALNLPSTLHKDTRGKMLMQKYCHAQYKDMDQIPLDEDWAVYKEYNGQDVVAEQAVWQEFIKAIAKAPDMYYKDLFREYAVSERINDTGIKIDIPFAKKMAELAFDFKEKSTINLELLCDMYASSHNKPRVTNPNSTEQIRELLGVPSLEKDQVKKFFRSLPRDAQRIIVTRESISQSSTAKYDRMLEGVCKDGRIRGEFKFYGAGTGRFAGQNVQLQNLKKNHFEDIEKARNEYFEDKAEFTGHYLSDIGELVRTALIPRDGEIFSDADYSAIEARVVAWVAGEKWVLDAFREGKDIYCETASQMYSLIRKTPVTVEKDGENGELRAIGKVATLACGYQGGVGAFNKMGGDAFSMSQSDKWQIVNTWREANPNITSFWKYVENCAKVLIKSGREGYINLDKEPMMAKGMKMTIRKSSLTGEFQLEIKLPVTGRSLIYPDIRIENKTETNRNGESFTKEQIIYKTPKGTDTIYGGKFTENIVQGIARDILIDAMSKLNKAGYPVVLHVHDEVLVEKDKNCVAEISGILASSGEKYEGLPLKAEGYTCEFFRKG